jgi:hypothetical protein
MRLSRYVKPYWAADNRAKYAGFADSRYYAPTVQELEGFLRNTPLQPTVMFGEVFDCDDYAFVMKGAASLFARDLARLQTGLCLGIAWGNFAWKPDPFHACNWVIDADGHLWWVEPQDHRVHDIPQCRGDLTLLLI